MASNLFTGRGAQILISSASSVATTKVGSVRNYQFQSDNAEMDATSFDSSGYFQMLDGIKKTSFKCESLVLSSVAALYTAQNSLRAAVIAGTRKFMQYKNSTGAATKTFQGFAYVTQWTQKGTHTDIQLGDFALVFDGKYTSLTA